MNQTLKSTGALEETQLLELIRKGAAKEHCLPNLELKRSWDKKYGEKLSALANRTPSRGGWLVVGVEDRGTLAGHPEQWAKSTEETISQQINERLSPILACKSVRVHEVEGSWVILINVSNPGDVVYWGTHAYTGSGTTIRALEPPEVMELRLRLPGLSDFTRMECDAGELDNDLVSEFVDKVSSRSSGAGLSIDPSRMLASLSVTNRQAARLLFGECSFRTVVFGQGGDVLLNRRVRSLYRLLRDDFFETLQADAKMQVASSLYPAKGLREGLANAVAHAAYFERDGDIIIELHPEKLVISNLCTPDSKYFANKWFSRSHHTVNGLLMETLRIAGDVDELGRGKSLIFSESIKAGRRPPEVITETAGRFVRWKLVLYAISSETRFLRLLDRCRDVYGDETLAMIAAALVLWRNKKVSEIRQYVDGDFAAQFVLVLASLDGPIFYSQETDQIFLTRWARVLLGEGKDSKELSRVEELQIFARAHNHCWSQNGGEMTPAELRKLCQMGDTKSEKSLSSRIIKKWVDEGSLQKIKNGKYAFTRPPVERKELRQALERLLASLQE